VIRHERIAEQVDRAKHQADDGHAGIQEGRGTVTTPETPSLRNHRHYPMTPRPRGFVFPAFGALATSFRPVGF
jgi:hypothetical protein